MMKRWILAACAAILLAGGGSVKLALEQRESAATQTDAPVLCEAEHLRVLEEPLWGEEPAPLTQKADEPEKLIPLPRAGYAGESLCLREEPEENRAVLLQDGETRVQVSLEEGGSRVVVEVWFPGQERPQRIVASSAPLEAGGPLQRPVENGDRL